MSAITVRASPNPDPSADVPVAPSVRSVESVPVTVVEAGVGVSVGIGVSAAVAVGVALGVGVAVDASTTRSLLERCVSQIGRAHV